jgi:hypothetical protein
MVIQENMKPEISPARVPGDAVYSVKQLKEKSLERILKKSGT